MGPVSESDAIRKAKNEIVLRKLNERIEEHHLRVQPDIAERGLQATGPRPRPLCSGPRRVVLFVVDTR